MTALLLLVTLMLTTGASAYLAYLVVDATITQPVRDRVLSTLRAPTQRDYEDAIDDYRERLNESLERGDGIPTDPPPTPDDPLLAKLITCRWCSGLWVSLIVAFIARLALTADYQPLWHSLPLQPVDLLIIPAWGLASAYAVGFLSTREGE